MARFVALMSPSETAELLFFDSNILRFDYAILDGPKNVAEHSPVVQMDCYHGIRNPQSHLWKSWEVS